MANNNDFEKQIDNALNQNAQNGQTTSDETVDNMSAQGNSLKNSAMDRISGKMQNSFGKNSGTLKENKSHSPSGSSGEAIDNNVKNMENKSNASRNINRAKEKAKTEAIRKAEGVKRKIRNIRMAVRTMAVLAQMAVQALLFLILTPIGWLILGGIFITVLFVNISAWFEYNVDNINGAFYNREVVNTIEYDPTTNEVTASKLSPDNVLAGVFFEYYAKASYYYTVTPYMEDGKNQTGKKIDVTLKQHTYEDSKDEDFKIKDKFGMESKFTLNSIMLMNLNKAINENIGQELYYPDSFIRPIYNTCSIADNSTLYDTFINKGSEEDSRIDSHDTGLVNLRKTSADEVNGKKNVDSNTLKDARCQRLNLLETKDDKRVAALSAKYKHIYLDESYNEIAEDEYKKQKNEGKTVYEAYQPVTAEYEYGTWSWGLAPIFNYEEFKEHDEVRNIKVSTVPVWNREKQKIENISYNALSDEQKEEYKDEAEKKISDKSMNEKYVYLINSVSTYMGNAANETELTEEFIMSNYTNFEGNQSKKTINIEKKFKSTDDETDKKFTDVVIDGEEKYKDIKGIFFGYSTADIDECKEIIKTCRAAETCDQYPVYVPDNKDEAISGGYVKEQEHERNMMNRCHVNNEHSKAVYIKDNKGKEHKIADSKDELDGDNVNVYYKDKAEGTVFYSGDLYYFRANYTDNIAKLENGSVNFDYISAYLNNFSMFAPLEQTEKESKVEFVKDVEVSIEDYAKYYATDEDGNPLVDTRNTNAENQKRIDDYVEAQKKKGNTKMTVRLFDPTFTKKDCSKKPGECIRVEDASSYEYLEGAMHYKDEYGETMTLFTPIKNNTMNNTSLTVSDRPRNMFLRVSELLGVNVGTDMDSSSSTFGNAEFTGTLIDGNLCVHEGTRGKNKTYMDYRKITSKTSDQYKYIYSHFDDGTLKVMDNGLLMTNDGFIGVALGSYYGEIGDKFVFTLGTGKQLKVVKLDEKADAHTDPNGCYHTADESYSTLEFVIQSDLAGQSFGRRGSYVAGGNFNNIEEFSGEIIGVQIAEGAINDSTGGTGNPNDDSNNASDGAITSNAGIAIGVNAQDGKIANIMNSPNYDIIKKYANMYGVDTNLMASIAAHMSGGENNVSNCKAKSKKACGFMGLKFTGEKLTVKDVLNTETKSNETFTITPEDAKDMETNIKFAAMSLASSLKKFEYNPLMAIYDFAGEKDMKKVLDDYAKKTSTSASEVAKNYSDIGWTSDISNAMPLLSNVLQYYPGSSMTFKKLEGNELKNVSVTLSSLNYNTIDMTTTVSENNMANKLQAKISSLTSGNLIDENWDLLFPNSDKDAVNVDYTNIDGEVVDGVKDYVKYSTYGFSEEDVMTVVYNGYLVGTNDSIESLDTMTELDWEQKFLEAFGKKGSAGHITTDSSKYFPDFSPMADTALSIYQPYGTVIDVDSGKRFYHDYVGVKAAQGTKIRNVSTGTVEELGRNDKEFGNYIIIRHGDKSVSKFTYLGALSSDLKEGQELSLGDVIGEVGEDSFNYSLQVDGKLVNPEWIIRNNADVNVSNSYNGNYTVTGDSELGVKIAKMALTKLGSPYVLGASHTMSQIRNPNQKTFDCSGLVSWAFYQSGVDIGSQNTSSLIGMGQAVSRSELQAGDIVFPSAHHVGIYIGDGKIVHAPQTGDVVKVSNIWSFYAARRLY